MNYTEFKNGLEEGRIFPIYLFEGEDSFFRERGLVLLKNKYLQEPDLNYATFSGEKLNENELLASLTAFPFMSQKRITLLREYYPKTNAISVELKNYFENPISDSIFIIINEKPSDAIKKLSNVCVVDCKKADSSIISRYVKGKCAQAGIIIDLENAKILAEYCLNDMTRVENETEKLISYAFNKKTVSLEDIELLVSKDTEYKIYELTDYIGKRDFEKAITVINELLNKGETLQRLLISLYNYFRRLLHIAISGKTDSQLAESFSIKEFAVKKARVQANAFKKKSLKNAVDILADTDYLIKSGVADGTDRIWYSIFSVITG